MEDHMKAIVLATLAVSMAGGTLWAFRPQEKPAHKEEPGHENHVKLNDARRAAAGIEVVPCEKRTLPVLVRTTGTVEVNADRVAHLASRLQGTVLEVSEKGHLGIRVEKGDELSTIHSLEFGKAQTDYLKALALQGLRQKTYDREKDLAERKISSGRELLEAEAELAQSRIDHQAAHNQLEVLGLGKEEIDALVAGKAHLGCMILRAPIAGVLIEKHVVRGEHVGTETNLFTIADLDRLWLFADIYERDLSRIVKGLRAEGRLAAYPDLAFSGQITHVGETMSVETRTLKVRIEVENKEGKLKPGMFASVDIAVAERPNALAVPEAAIQTQKQHAIVFVEEEKNVFERRPVRTGIRFGGFVEILDGVKEGDKVVSSGSFLLKSELEKESFGGGD
jgi:cobalt-zinc-cadmium efflux system membrane fusion protein